MPSAKPLQCCQSHVRSLTDSILRFFPSPSSSLRKAQPRPHNRRAPPRSHRAQTQRPSPSNQSSTCSRRSRPHTACTTSTPCRSGPSTSRGRPRHTARRTSPMLIPMRVRPEGSRSWERARARRRRAGRLEGRGGRRGITCWRAREMMGASRSGGCLRALVAHRRVREDWHLPAEHRNVRASSQPLECVSQSQNLTRAAK